jgi:hypothetical protein
MFVVPAQMFAVTETDHVVRKNDGSHAGQRSAAMLLVGSQSSSLRSEGMAMRTEDSRMWSFFFQWSIEVSVDQVTRAGFKGSRLDRVSGIAAFFMNDRVKWCSFWQWVKLGSTQDLIANLVGPFLPLLKGGIGGCHAGQLFDCILFRVVVSDTERRFGWFCGDGGSGWQAEKETKQTKGKALHGM